MKTKMRTAVVGCGMISEIYLSNMIYKYPNLEVLACASRHMEHARQRARQFHIRACTYEEILKMPEIELVVVLTPAPTHFELIRQALLAGKHVYTEKTMTLQLSQAEELLSLANARGLYLGSAPDTFLGNAIQTAKKTIQDGRIGEVTSFMVSVNRNLDLMGSMYPFLRMPGGGICYDYGVYYLTALVSLLGSVVQVNGMVKNRSTVRTNIWKDSPDFGKTFSFPNESQVMAGLQLEHGITGTFALHGDSLAKDLALFYIYGTEGILTLPNPDLFDGEVCLIQSGTDPLNENHVSVLREKDGKAENQRGMGVSLMAQACLEQKNHPANKELAYHVMEVIDKIMESSRSKSFEPVYSRLKM